LNLEAAPDGISTHGPIFLSPVFLCDQAINAKASALAVNVGTATSVFISDSNWNTIHKNYQSGAIYCKLGTTQAYAVYGEIWLKWVAQNGNYGYPITDETGTTDNTGTVIRYNTFSDGTNNMAIYFTSAHGACLIHGNIYGAWLSIGDVKSSIGYPITDETGSGSAGGRYNDFSNGMIYWHAGTYWVHVGSISDSLFFSTGPVNFPTGTTTFDITFDISGQVRMQATSGSPSGDYTPWEIGVMMVDADGTAISMYEGSNGETPYIGFDVVVQSALISDNWRAWISSTYWKWLPDLNDDESGLMFEVLQSVQTGYPSVLGATSIISGTSE
jgi:hypothetical protein